VVKQQWPRPGKIHPVKNSLLEVPSGAPLGIPVLFDSLDSIGSGTIQLDPVEAGPVIDNFNGGDFSRRSTTE
jgi:hypothetical protein